MLSGASYNFNNERRSSIGGSVYSWLIEREPVQLKNHIPTNNDLPLVDEVELLKAEHQYTHVLYGDGQEKTESLYKLIHLSEDTFGPNEILYETNKQVDSCLPCNEQLNENLRGDPLQEPPRISDAEDAPPF